MSLLENRGVGPRVGSLPRCQQGNQGGDQRRQSDIVDSCRSAQSLFQCNVIVEDVSMNLLKCVLDELSELDVGQVYQDGYS